MTMPITPHEALQRTIEHREIFHDEMLTIMRMIMPTTRILTAPLAIIHMKARCRCSSRWAC